MKKIFLVLLFMLIVLLVSKTFEESFAYSYDIDTSVLFYKEDFIELENDIKIYLNNIDDYIIPNSSFNYSDKLIDNYDFLVYFALDYVLDNKEYYNKNIEKLDNCLYVNKDNIDTLASNYINLDIIYEITDFYFGVKDFVVINNDVCIFNNYISLTDYAVDKFGYNINDISITKDNEFIKVLANYDNGNKYLYFFRNVNNVLKIENVEVVK